MKPIKMTYKNEWKNQLNNAIMDEVNHHSDFNINLAIYINDNDIASKVYINSKLKYAKQLIHTNVKVHNTINQTYEMLIQKICDDMNNNYSIMAQQPYINEDTKHAIKGMLNANKNYIYDVEALSYKYQLNRLNNIRKKVDLTKLNIYPCTVAGNIKLIKEYLPKYKLQGKIALVIGRSEIVGIPMAEILEGLNCTVIHANSYTKDLNQLCKIADIIVSCVGKPNLVQDCKKGAILIDNGCSIVKGHQHGDISQDCWEKSLAYTPWINATGKATVHCLFENAYLLSKYRFNKKKSKGR